MLHAPNSRRGEISTMWQQQANKLFEDWNLPMLHAYFGGGRGSLLVDDEEHITAALIDIGDFCFLAGTPSQRLLAKIIGSKLLVPRDEAWERLIEAFYGSRAKKFTRYAIKKEPNAFDKAKLQAYVDTLDKDYQLRLFDREAFELALSEEWSYDLCSQFDDYADYEKRGLGMAIFHEGKLIAGVAPYATYPDGIEIEIDTKPKYRQKGLATVCGAALILECLQRGLYPGWDAHDLRSLALAEKLGYHLDYPYTAYELIEEEEA